MRDYRGKMQFTEINHSNRAKNAGYRGKMQFTEINHSNRAQNTGL
jgi:hypothetical protein